MTTAELLTRRLELIYRWHQGMVNTDTGMLEYLYLPETGVFVRESCPIREIASVWDTARVGRFLNRLELQPLIERSLEHYGRFLVERDGFLILDPRRLGEPSSIAHSAFMLLALLRTPPPRRERQIAGLAEGILRQQRPDGSYRVYFHDLPDQGEELYAGEAMLALLEAFRDMGDSRHLRSAERGFAYYDAQYFRTRRVGADLLVFFANWQSQAGRLLFESTRSTSVKQAVRAFLYRMHDQIIDRGVYEAVERHPDRQVSVEVACALEGLNEAYAVARSDNDARGERYRRCICTGLTYLLRLQCTRDGAEWERGGFGMSTTERAQRIDVTGHAASAFMKSVENGIECGLPSA